MTALHWAAERGDAELADGAARRRRATSRPTTRLGRHTPLHVAAAGGHDGRRRGCSSTPAPTSTAMTTTGAAPLHFAAASGSVRGRSRCSLERGADVNVREPQWGQTPLMFAAAAGRTDAVKALLAARRRSARRRQGRRPQRAQSRGRRREPRAQRAHRGDSEASAPPSRWPRSPAARRRAPARGARPRGDDDGNEPEPLGYAELVGAHGGLTALLLAARDGLDETAMALLDGGADINQVSAGDRTSPLLMATINGHFDLAMRLLERGADVTLASDGGATPLYGVLNMQWAPKARHPQPAHYMQQQTGYLELAEAFLKAGADPQRAADASRSGTPPTTAICSASIARARRRSGSPPTRSTSRR